MSLNKNEIPVGDEQDAGVWGEDAEYPRSSWKDDVLNDNTNLGYWEWVDHNIESHAGEIKCTVCDSYEVMSGETSVNLDGEMTITYVCLVCGHAWETPEEER